MRGAKSKQARVGQEGLIDDSTLNRGLDLLRDLARTPAPAVAAT